MSVLPNNVGRPCYTDAELTHSNYAIRLSDYHKEVERRWEASLRGELVFVPDGLWLSVTENCNFRCVGCYTDGLFKKTYVSPEDVERMVAGQPGSFRYISLTEGEAFLHPQLLDIIKICRAHHPDALIDLVTNASIPPKGRFRDALTMVDSLGVSIDGAKKETYEAIRRGGNFEKFLENVSQIVAIRAEFGNPRVLEFSFTAMTTNLPELPGVVRLAAELGVPSVYAQPMEMNHPEILARVGAFHLSHMEFEEIYHIIEQTRVVGVETGVQVALGGMLGRPHRGPSSAREPARARQQYEIRTCQYPYVKPFQYVRSGSRYRVLPCCYMQKSAADVMAERYGMDFDTPRPVAEVYNSPGFWRFRKDLAGGMTKTLCGDCLQARTYVWKPEK